MTPTHAACKTHTACMSAQSLSSTPRLLEEDTAESGRLRLLADIDANRLMSRTKTVYSCILYEFYMYIKAVQTSEPGKYEGCVKQDAQKPCPMGEYDGLSFFIQSCPLEDDLFLSLLEYKNRKKEKRVHRTLPYDSGETIWHIYI